MSRSLEILVLEQVAVKQPRGGVARYVRQMIAALNKTFGDKVAVCSDLSDLPADTRRVRLPQLGFRGMYRIGLDGIVLKGQTRFFNRLVNQLKPALVFSPFCGLIAKGVPQVFTVYDFALERYPDLFIKRLLPRQLALMQECYRAAAALLCISESTRRDLLHFYPFVNPELVHVTHLGVDEDFLRSDPCPPTAEASYILFVGNRDVRKNFKRLLEAFAESGLARDYELRVVTPQSTKAAQWTPAEIGFIRAQDITHRVKLEAAISEDRLRQLYRGASFFVYPSEYEGFGLPILEAMASRTIVLCSNTSSLPEVAGDAAIYFDPFDTSSISQALQKATSLSPSERAHLIEKGFARARAFSWSKCTDKTISILQQVLARYVCRRSQ